MGLVLLLVLFSRAGADSQVPYVAGTTYAQSFDSLAQAGTGNAWSDNVTIPGWYAYRSIAGTPTTYDATTGSSSTYTFYSCGVAGVNAVTDRAFCGIPDSGKGDVMIGVRLTNNTVSTITTATITYTGEQWRAACTQPRTLSCSYQIVSGSLANLNSGSWTPDAGLAFTSPIKSIAGALDGNAPANRQVLTDTLTGLNWGPGQDLWIRWINPYISGGSHDLCVDDFSLTAQSPVDTSVFVNQGTADIDRLAFPNSADAHQGDGAEHLAWAAEYCLALKWVSANYTTAYPSESGKPQAYVDEAENLLAQFFALELQSGPDTGRFPENTGSTAIGNQFENFFALRAIGVIYYNYGSLVDSSGGTIGAWLLANYGTTYANNNPPNLIELALVGGPGGGGMANQSIGANADYTNIWTMRLTDQYLLGKMVNDVTSQYWAVQNLDLWITALKAHGLEEYASPNYTLTTYDNLLMLYNNAAQGGSQSDTEVATKAMAGLEYVAQELASNYYSIGEKMSGSHARDYEFIEGDGESEGFYYLYGLRGEKPGTSPWKEWVFTYLNTIQPGSAYQPSLQILSSAQLPTRVVKETFGSPGSNRDRYNYVTPDFAIGSSGNTYGPQDKNINIDMEATYKDSHNHTHSEIAVYPETTDNRSYVYGTTGNPVIDSNKPNHPTSSFVTVQDQGMILAISNLIPAQYDSQNGYQYLATDVLLPADFDQTGSNLENPCPTQLWLGTDPNQNPLPESSWPPSNKKLLGTGAAGLNQVVGIVAGNAVTAIRFFFLDSFVYAPGKTSTPAVYLDNDGPLGNQPAGRLAAYNYHNDANNGGILTPITPTNAARTGLFIVTAKIYPPTPQNISAFLSNVQSAPVTVTQQTYLNATTWSASVTLADPNANPNSDTLYVQQDTSGAYAPVRLINNVAYDASERFSVASGGSTTDYAAMLIDPLSTTFDLPPVVITNPAANPATVAVNGTTSLSCSILDPATLFKTGSSATYTWSTVSAPAGAAAITFGPNNTKIANQTKTTALTVAGTYVFMVKINDSENQQPSPLPTQVTVIVQ